jgi:hypothetical protein
MNWRPAHEWRGTRRNWLEDARLHAIVMSELAARAIYRCVCLFPVMLRAENDRDHHFW